ncbi:MAG: TonB-dependent receptor [Tannerella sp.]|jgi:TonB-linked SusC/RagA family outer membrane protein|nr:TonB-dependent receptor [Tannerella sp.]
MNKKVFPGYKNPEKRDAISKRFLCCLAGLFLLSLNLQAKAGLKNEVGSFNQQNQTVKISGTVIDETGETMPGVNVVVKGTTQGTITDVDGKFSLDVQQGSTIVISFIGMVTQEIVITNQRDLKITLVSDTETLEEVVVIGYGVIKKKDLTGAIGGLKAEQLDQQSNGNLGSAIQGKIAGVTVESAGGAPGSGTRIQVRGAGSLNNNNPLILVDDIAVTSMNNLNPYDIESIQVLKDASAAAIYGSRAANGVIMITTKSGKRGEMKVSFDAVYGISKVNKKLDLLTAEEWTKVSNAAYDAAGKAHLDIAENPEVPGKGTDWQDEIFRTAPTQNYSLGLSGGSDNLKYNMSLGYYNQEGVIEKTNYDRLNLRVKTDYTKGIFKIGETVMITKENRKDMPGVGGQGGNVIGAATMMLPGFKVYDENAIGGYGGAKGAVLDVFNPVAALNLIDSKNDYYQALVNLYGEVSLYEGLKYKLNVGVTTTEHKSYLYTPVYEVGSIFSNTLNSLAETSDLTKYYQVENTLSYMKDFGKHSINLLVGQTVYQNDYRIIRASAKGMPDGIKVLDAGTEQAAATGYTEKNRLLSFLGRAIYSYDNRYIMTATFRRDGSSRFSPENRWGNFPSISGAWNLENERFFADLNTPVTELKLRTSYGILGNQEIGNYQYLGLITPAISYAVGEPNKLWVGNIQTEYPAAGLKWESTATFDVGLDLGLWNGRMNFTFDYFEKTTSDLLLRVPIPLSVGAKENPYTNAGKVSNKGFEMSLEYNGNIRDFNYSVTGNLSHTKNEVVELSTGTQKISGGTASHHGSAVTYSEAGYPIYSFFLVKTDGLFRSQEEINAHSKDGKLIQPRADLGDIRYVDANGDGQINGEDRQYCGSPFPDFEYGIRLQGEWKGIDLSMFFQGTQGGKIYNGAKSYTETVRLNTNYSKETLNSYTYNPNSNFPRLNIDDPNDNGADYSDRFLENSSYFRCKTIQLGYTLPVALTKKAFIERCRIYVAGDNLFTITDYSGYNPDIAGNGLGTRGIDFRVYPLNKTYQIGLQLNF